ncbi:putative sodium-dependent phosphate transport protein 2B-like, partial [Homarus americanus]
RRSRALCDRVLVECTCTCPSRGLKLLQSLGMVKKAGSKLVKKSKKHGIPRDELVTVKSDLILLAPEFEDIEEKRLEGSTWSRPNQRDPEDPHKGQLRRWACLCGDGSSPTG